MVQSTRDKRTTSMDLHAIRGSMNESPPPPPPGMATREWFAGLALMNAELMRAVPATMRVAEAVRLADELMAALAVPRLPSQESMAAPSETDMGAWDQHVTDKREKTTPATRDTQPAVPRQLHGASTRPTDHFRRASDDLAAARAESTRSNRPGRYSSLGDENCDE